MANVITVTDTAQLLTETPFAPGFQAVFVNLSGAASTLQGSDDGTTYSTVVNAAALDTMTQVTSLPRYVKLAAAGSKVYLLQGGN